MIKKIKIATINIGRLCNNGKRKTLLEFCIHNGFDVVAL